MDAVVIAVERVRAYLAAHAASHRNPDVIANLVPSGQHGGEVVELRVDDLQAVLDLERAALDVVKAGSVDPGARRVVVPVDLFDVLRRRLEPIYR